MSQSRLVATCIVIALFTTASGFAQHYYSGGGTIALQIDSSKVVIRFDEEAGLQDQESLLLSMSRIDSTVDDLHTLDGFIACALSTGEGYSAFLDSVRAVDGVYLVEPYYLDNQDSAFLVGMTFCVAFEQSVTRSRIDAINALYRVVIDREIPGMFNVFVLRNTDSSGSRLLDLANAYYELPETRYSHPEFGVWIEQQSYQLFDYYNNAQSHIKKVIGSFNSASVWDFAGLSDDLVVVALLDEGVVPHEDLPYTRVMQGYDFYYRDNYPTPGPYRAHGMACAGLIGASHTTDSMQGLSTSSGMISMNPRTEIMPIKIFDDNGGADDMTVSTLAEAITFAYKNGADVLSNSWSYHMTCSDAAGGYFDVLTDAIDSAAAVGRAGLGCPVIFCTGNHGSTLSGVSYPACLPSILSVGAVRMDDSLWSYSCHGSDIDVVAPSGATSFQGDVWSLDQMSGLGYNPNRVSDCPPASNDQNYHCRFGGTSAAAPVVAGVASLILAREPRLTAQEVYDILKGSAVTNLDWGTITPPDDEYGYGRVDAYRAILSIARGDANNSGDLSIGDVSLIINHEFIDGQPIWPDSLLGDVNCDGDVSIGDVTMLIDHLFVSGNPLPLPCFEFND